MVRVNCIPCEEDKSASVYIAESGKIVELYGRGSWRTIFRAYVKLKLGEIATRASAARRRSAERTGRIRRQSIVGVATLAGMMTWVAYSLMNVGSGDSVAWGYALIMYLFAAALILTAGSLGFYYLSGSLGFYAHAPCDGYTAYLLEHRPWAKRVNEVFYMPMVGEVQITHGPCAFYDSARLAKRHARLFQWEILDALDNPPVGADCCGDGGGK